MSQITIDQLPPELQALLGGGTRSPVRAPLQDLREPSDPKARINRPNFFFEMGQAEPYAMRPYPALRYRVVSGQLEERRVDTAAQDDAAQREGWSDKLPLMAPPTPSERKVAELEALQAALAEMNPAERANVLKDYNERKRQSVLDRLAALSDDEFGAIEFVEEPERRGPGRPKGT